MDESVTGRGIDLTKVTPKGEVILSDFADLPLLQRMREAAPMLTEVAEKGVKSGQLLEAPWGIIADTLVALADRWEAEEQAAKAEQDAMVEELAADLYENHYDGSEPPETRPLTRSDCRVIAERLAPLGWRKGGSDE